jgi:hypothetical protein
VLDATKMLVYNALTYARSLLKDTEILGSKIMYSHKKSIMAMFNVTKQVFIVNKQKEQVPEEAQQGVKRAHHQIYGLKQ